jgi:NADH-quinone oxidoreductase subunit E
MAAMDVETIDRIISRHEGRPGSLIHALMEIQHANHWLPRDALVKVSQKLDVPLSRVMQVATFYKTFSLVPRGRHAVHVCTGTSCHVRGSGPLLDQVQDLTGIRPGETDSDARFSLETGSCLGCCNVGPEIIVNGRHHGRLTPAGAGDVLKDYE